MGKAKLGKSARQLFVFAPNVDAKSESPYRVLAFDDDEKSFPMATVRAINLASVPVRYDFSGGVQVEIAPGQSLQLPQAKEVNEYNLYHVTVNYKNAAGEWVESSTTNWKSSEKKREIAVTEFSNDSQTLTVRLYGDLPPWRK